MLVSLASSLLLKNISLVSKPLLVGVANRLYATVVKSGIYTAEFVGEGILFLFIFK